MAAAQQAKRAMASVLEQAQQAKRAMAGAPEQGDSDDTAVALEQARVEVKSQQARAQAADARAATAAEERDKALAAQAEAEAKTEEAVIAAKSQLEQLGTREGGRPGRGASSFQDIVNKLLAGDPPAFLCLVARPAVAEARARPFLLLCRSTALPRIRSQDDQTGALLQ
eukprot:5249918-Prymnesium_polylepis.1